MNPEAILKEAFKERIETYIKMMNCCGPHALGGTFFRLGKDIIRR